MAACNVTLLIFIALAVDVPFTWSILGHYLVYVFELANSAMLSP